MARKRKRKLSARQLRIGAAFGEKAPHVFTVPMMTEYEYMIAKGAAITPFVEGNFKIAREILEFILECGIPDEKYCSWKKFPALKAKWGPDMEWMEHYNVHGDHDCVVYAPPAKPKKRYVYDD